MAWKHLWSFALGIIFLYAQLLLMPAFELFGVIPCILVPWLIYLVWTREIRSVLIIGFVIGLMYDTTQPASFGLHALLFVILAFSLDQFRKPFEADSVVARMLTILLANLIFHLIQVLVLGVTWEFDSQLLLVNAIGFCYDLVLSFAIFWAMQFLSRLRLVIVHD